VFFYTAAPELEPLVAIEPMGPLVIDPPAFATQQDMDPAMAIAVPLARQLAQPLAERGLIGPTAPVAHQGALDPGRPTRPPPGDPQRVLRPGRPRPAHRRP